jgi:pimeloyl-ACP methyl ester carboxylesterase
VQKGRQLCSTHCAGNGTSNKKITKEVACLRVIAVPKVKVDDIQIYYEVKGEGFPLIMIQGLSRSLDGWDPRLIEALSKEFKLVMFDNRGAGRTDISDTEYTMKLFANDTAGLMNALGISKAHMLGISMGGMIAQELALSYPEKAAKLVLCSTGSQWCFSQEAARILSAVSESSQEELTRMLLSFKFASDFPRDFVRKNPFVVILFTSDFVKEHPDLVELLVLRAAKHPISKEGWMRQLNAMRGFNTHERLQKISVPTLSARAGARQASIMLASAVDKKEKGGID